MDYQRFLQTLPELYVAWGQPAVRPCTPRFHEMMNRVRGMTSPNVLQLLHHAVGWLEPGEDYAEVGCFQGATLIGALLDRPEQSAYAVDNFSEFDPDGQNERRLVSNLAAFGIHGQVHFANQDFEPFLLNLRDRGVRLGVYFYDGSHDYRSQLMGLLLAVPLLAERALLVVDDGNFPAVKQAIWDFLAVRPEAQLLLELLTPGNCHPSFWNGVYVLGWDAKRRNAYDWEMFQRGRQSALLESLDVLQLVNLKKEGTKIYITPAG